MPVPVAHILGPLPEDYPVRLRRRPAIVLSAADVPEDEENPDRNRPDLALDATIFLVRAAARHGVDVVMRGDPALTTAALSEAARFRAVVWALHDDGRFGSEWLEIADARGGYVIPADGPLISDLLVRTPSALAAIFIGGADDAVLDYDALRLSKPDTPIYPIASTGSAARFILDTMPQNKLRPGRNIDPTVLTDSPSYPLVMRRIFDDFANLIVDFRPNL